MKDTQTYTCAYLCGCFRLRLIFELFSAAETSCCSIGWYNVYCWWLGRTGGAAYGKGIVLASIQNIRQGASTPHFSQKLLKLCTTVKYTRTGNTEFEIICSKTRRKSQRTYTVHNSYQINNHILLPQHVATNFTWSFPGCVISQTPNQIPSFH